MALEAELAMVDNAAVNAIERRHGILHEDDELFWENDDDEEDAEMQDGIDNDQEEWADNGQANAWTNSGDIGGGIIAGFELWEERTLTAQEKEAKRDEYVQIPHLLTLNTNQV